MTINLCTRSSAIIEARVTEIMRAFDCSLDVREDLRTILEDLWSVALAAGVASGVESVHSGKFDEAVASVAREMV